MLQKVWGDLKAALHPYLLFFVFTAPMAVNHEAGARHIHRFLSSKKASLVLH